MIPPASALKKWVMLTIAVLMPLTFESATVRGQQVQASQNKSLDSPALPNGVYLYGDTPQPNRISHNYVLFQHQNGRVVGAFYSPRSEFSCFASEMRGAQLNVEAAINGEPRPIAADTSLAGLHSIQTLSANDRRILSVCQRSEIARSIE